MIIPFRCTIRGQRSIFSLKRFGLLESKIIISEDQLLFRLCSNVSCWVTFHGNFTSTSSRLKRLFSTHKDRCAEYKIGVQETPRDTHLYIIPSIEFAFAFALQWTLGGMVECSLDTMYILLDFWFGKYTHIRPEWTGALGLVFKTAWDYGWVCLASLALALADHVCGYMIRLVITCGTNEQVMNDEGSVLSSIYIQCRVY